MPSALQFSPRLRDVRATSFDTLERHWNDPVYRMQQSIEAEHQNALNNATMDRRMVATDNRFPSNWTAQEKHDAIERMMK